MISGRWVKLFLESFVPVIIVILGLFLMLLYVQFRAEFDAEKVTVINIQPIPVSDQVDAGVVSAQGEPEPLVSEGADSEHQRAAELMAQSKWLEAEKIYQAILLRKSSSQAINDLGVLYLRKGDLPRALGLFNQAIEVNPSDTSALFNRALALSRSGSEQKAIDSYRKLLAIQSSHFEGQYNLAVLLLRKGDKISGAAELEKAVKLASGERKARALHSLGLARRDLDQPDDAVKAFEAAIRLRPGDPEPRIALAAMEPDTAEGHARALAQYRKVLELVPNYSPALINMASVLSAQHKRRDAEQLLRKAIQFDPESLRAHSALGLLLLAEKRWQEARNEFEWLLQRNLDREGAYFNLGRVAYGEKDYDKAVIEYQKALKAASGSFPEAQLNLGLAYSAKKNYAMALAAYDDALKARRQYPEAWYNKGMVYLRQKNYDKAENAFKAAVRLRPDYEQAWFNLGVVYGNSDRDIEAMDAYRKALSIRPDYHQAQLNLAVRHARRKEYGDAIRLYRAILARDESYSMAWFNLGNAYIEDGKSAEAVAALQKAIALEPSNTKTLRFLGRALLLDGNHGEAVKVLESAVAADPADARLRLELARALRHAGRDSDARAELAKAQQLDPDLRGIEEEIQKFDEQ